MVDVNYKMLQDNVKALNDACGTEIKVISVKKDSLIKNFKDAMENGLEGVPQNIAEYYAATFGTKAPPDAEEAEKDAEETPDAEEKVKDVTAFGNSVADLAGFATILKIEVTEATTAQKLETAILAGLDKLKDVEWNALPKPIQDWDLGMTDKLNASKATAKDEKKKAAAAKKKADAPEGEPAKKKEHGARPDFKFSEGTNAAEIMDVFGKLFAASKGEGVKLKDLQDASVKAKVKSGNIPGRVTAVVRYAMTEEGGSQVVKVGGLVFPADKAPTEKK